MGIQKASNPLWTRDFTIITLGSIISMFGNALAGFAVSLLVLDYTKSSLFYAIYIIVYTLPQIIMPIFSGAVLDRFSRKNTIYTLDFISAGLYAIGDSSIVAEQTDQELISFISSLNSSRVMSSRNLGSSAIKVLHGRISLLPRGLPVSCFMLLVCFFCLCSSGCYINGRGEGAETGQTQENSGRVQREIFAMDTIMDLTVYGSHAGEAVEQAVSLIHKLDKTFSVTNSASDIARLNAAEGKAVSVSEDTYELITRCQEISEMTDGLFDISVYPLVKAWGFTTDNLHVPTQNEIRQALAHVDYRKIKLLPENKIQIPENMQLDLGAAAKGYLSQKLMELFKSIGVDSALVSLGGNVQTMGTKEGGSNFVIGITDPSDGASIYGTIKVKDKAVITSGIYQRYFEENGVRYHHIMDRRTGKPAENSLSSVTAICDEGWKADALATALYVMGEEKAVAFQKEHPEIGIILIRKDGSFWQSDGVGLSVE